MGYVDMEHLQMMVEDECDVHEVDVDDEKLM